MFASALVPIAAFVTLGIEGPPRQAVDGNLLAWHGCWREVSETAAADAPLLCVLPGTTAGEARLITIVDGVAGPPAVLRVDGVSRPTEEGGCTGTETASWSRDDRRIFVRTELDCAGMRRVSTGVLAMIAENEWVDAQSASVGGQQAARTLRYRAVPAAEVPQEIRAQLPAGRDLVLEAARLHAARPLQIEDIIEASARVDAPALQGLLTVQAHSLTIDARSLLALERGGVPREVIDVVVAVSYPQRFAVRQSAETRHVDVARRSGYGSAAECWDPWLRMRRFGTDCDREGMLYGYRYGYGYGSRYGFGYSPWGYDYRGWNYGAPVVVVIREPRETPGSGEMVKGSGYSRGGSGRSGSAQPRSSTSQPASPAVSSGSSSGSAATGSGTGSSTSGSSSTSGDTGRTAQPRNGGGG